MKTIFYIARWEFITRFKTRSFLFSTFILPVFFSLLITLPVYFITYEESVSTKLVGIINLDNDDLTEKLQNHLNKNYKLQSGSPEYIILPISVENSPVYKTAFDEFQETSDQLDSLVNTYSDLKIRREQYYKRKDIKNKQYVLQKSYEDLIRTREIKELTEIDYEYYKIKLDSVFNSQARLAADSLLFKKILNAYLVLPANVYRLGFIEYHSLTPGDLLDSERIQKIINEINYSICHTL